MLTAHAAGRTTPTRTRLPAGDHEVTPDRRVLVQRPAPAQRHGRQVVSTLPGPHSCPLPVIRLHDLRHTHATLLLAKGVPVMVVSERLGLASATITLQMYAHVMPGNQRQAADLFASLIKGAGA